MAHDPLQRAVRDWLGICDLHEQHTDTVRRLASITRRLARIERAINAEGAIMSEVDDRTAQLVSEVADLSGTLSDSSADVDRALTDLKNALAGNLSADQAAAFDALDQSVAGLKSAAASIKTAVENVDPTPDQGA